VSFTFDATDISTDLARVRMNIGDTDSANPLLTDEQINAILASNTDVNMASAAACDQIAASFARKVDVGALSGNWTASQLFDHYTKMADRLRRLGPGDVPGGSGNRGGGIVVTGTLESDYDDAATDTTYAKGPFRLGQDRRQGGYHPNRDSDDEYYD